MIHGSEELERKLEALEGIADQPLHVLVRTRSSGFRPRPSCCARLRAESCETVSARWWRGTAM